MESRKKTTYLWRAQPDTLKRLRIYCAKNSWPINAVVEDAICQYLDKYEKSIMPPQPPDIRPKPDQKKGVSPLLDN